MRRTAAIATVGIALVLGAGIAGAQQLPPPPPTIPETTTTVPETTTTIVDEIPTTTVATTTTSEDVIAEEVSPTLPATGGGGLPTAQLAIAFLAAGALALMSMRRAVPAGSQQQR